MPLAAVIRGNWCYNDASCCTQLCSAVLHFVLLCSAVLCCAWLLMVAAGCCWLLLVAAGCCWLLLVAAGCCCCCCRSWAWCVLNIRQKAERKIYAPICPVRVGGEPWGYQHQIATPIVVFFEFIHDKTPTLLFKIVKIVTLLNCCKCFENILKFAPFSTDIVSWEIWSFWILFKMVAWMLFKIIVAVLTWNRTLSPVKIDHFPDGTSFNAHFFPNRPDPRENPKLDLFPK